MADAGSGARRAGADVAENDQVDRRRHLGNGVSQAQDDAARGQVLVQSASSQQRVWYPQRSTSVRHCCRAAISPCRYSRLALSSCRVSCCSATGSARASRSPKQVPSPTCERRLDFDRQQARQTLHDGESQSQPASARVRYWRPEEFGKNVLLIGESDANPVVADFEAHPRRRLPAVRRPGRCHLPGCSAKHW